MTVLNSGTEIIAMNVSNVRLGCPIYLSNVNDFKYNGGNGRNVALTADKGHFGTAYPVITFSGSGPSPRQTSSHPHQVVEYGSEYLVPDLVRLNT